jgi:hypothetical protein
VYQALVQVPVRSRAGPASAAMASPAAAKAAAVAASIARLSIMPPPETA